jgi:hypothetical protein
LLQDTPGESLRTVWTILLPPLHSQTKDGIKEGGCCKSASRVITAAPLASDSPAKSAYWCPKLRVSRRPLTRESLLWSPTMHSQVLSGLPSSTIISSQAHRSGVRLSTSSSCKCSRLAASFLRLSDKLAQGQRLPTSGRKHRQKLGRQKRSGYRAS